VFVWIVLLVSQKLGLLRQQRRTS